MYPSYPDPARDPNPEDRSKVLIVSYCWTQDAERLGALMKGDGTARDELLDVVFRDLAAVHGMTDVNSIKQYFEAYHAWDWLHDPLTMGSCFFADRYSGFSNGFFRCICILWTGIIRYQ